MALIDFDGKPLQIQREPLIQIKIQNRCHAAITLDSIFLKRDSDYENLSIENCLLPETTLPLQVKADNYEELKINRANLALSLNNNLKRIRYLDKRLVIFLRDTGGKEYKVNLPGKAKEYADFGGTKA